jgi:tRNA(fMet)-specific endonuclease VapC
LIADTSFLIDLMRGQQGAILKLNEVIERNLGQYIASPTVMELAVGVSLANLPKKEQDKIDEIIGGFQVLPFDAVSAWRAGIELGKLKKSGVTVDPIDAQIAGIALQNDDVIVTRNIKHFERFKGLRVEGYS